LSLYLIKYYNYFYWKNLFVKYYIVNGDWGLGIGDWGLGIGPNPQIPNPQSPIPNPHPQYNLILMIRNN